MGAISSTQWWTRDSQPLLIFVCPSFPRTEEQRTFSGIVCWRLIFSCSQSACILTWDIQLCGKQAFAKDFFSLKQISWQKWTLLHTFMFSFLFCFSCFLNHEFFFCEFFFFFFFWWRVIVPLVGWLIFLFCKGLMNLSFSSAHSKCKLLSWLLVEPVPSDFTEHKINLDKTRWGDL